VPQLLFLHAASGLLVLEEIRGVTLKEHIRASAEEEQVRCAREFGRMVAVMHCADMLHGDLTTSNVMVERVEGGEGQLVLIDFGLSETSTSHEDKAVDLYVLERAFDSTHPGQRYLVDACLAGYLDANADAARPVLQRLDNVRSRGRKRVAFG
jgi:TP53 regulating kinase and related kinases